jgi:hypothetical protein
MMTVKYYLHFAIAFGAAKFDTFTFLAEGPFVAA